MVPYPTNTQPPQPTTWIVAGSGHHLDVGDLFVNDGRVWEATEVEGDAVKGRWVSNDELRGRDWSRIAPLPSWDE